MVTKILENSDFDRIIEILNNDGIVAIKTDTVFGLACKYDSSIGIEKIYEAKHRPDSKALPLMLTKDMLKEYVNYDSKYQKIIDTYMPGPLTIVCNDLRNSENTIAIRIPDDEFIVKIINTLNLPLWVTSANISGKPSLMKWEDVYNSLNNKVDAIVKGISDGKKASTIISIVNGLKILRSGPISEEDLRSLI